MRSRQLENSYTSVLYITNHDLYTISPPNVLSVIFTVTVSYCLSFQVLGLAGSLQRAGHLERLLTVSYSYLVTITVRYGTDSCFVIEKDSVNKRIRILRL